MLLIISGHLAIAQTPVPMASQPGLSYTENFTDIGNWADNFASGIGANRFASVPIGGSTAIPSATKITTATNVFQITGNNGGVQKGTIQTPATNNIVLLATGTTDNTNSAAIDILMDYTGVNAGTVSFDWASVNNSSGNRSGSLRVYASIDNINFTELTSADVLNFTNNILTSGSVTNVALPALFNNTATTRLRFYYHNGVGGTTGSRPKISIDNLTVTAVGSSPCTTPTAQPTGISFTTVTDVAILGIFSAASPAPNEYITIMSVNSNLTSAPVNGVNYNLGDNVGDGTVIAKGSALSFNASGLTQSTNYYFFIFSLNSVCSGGPLYLVTNPLSAGTTTEPSFPACTTPAGQPTNLVWGTIGINSIQGSFTATAADEYLVLRTTAASLTVLPANGNVYNAGDALGNSIVVQRSSALSFTANSLAASTQYHFFIFSLNSQTCSLGPVYNTSAPLTGVQTTAAPPPCATPTTQATALTFNASSTSVSGVFTAGTNADDYLTVRSLSPSLSALPVDNTDYTVGMALGGGIVIANSSVTSFITNNLTPNTTYYFFVFAANKNCSGGTKYLTVNPLTGNTTTSNTPANNYYFGNLHAHSDYSDGNQDNPGYTPTNDYNYAMISQCMDFLGISEHNHFSSPNNPGNLLSNYHLGITQADNFTTANPNFLALYGMEWGVISNGGHVLVYGNGMNNLFGWESNVGGVPGPNYDVFVPKSEYTTAGGLFKIINDNVASNSFGSLAHPNSSDYDNIGNNAYNTIADNAITATAVESGPATSTNTSYSNPGSSMSYLWYYQTLLARGYHLGPTIDHDNHNTTFGRTTYSRTALIAPALTKTEIIKAFREMHFYATQDCDTKVDFTINTKIMGSITTGQYGPVISVNLTDATTSTSGAIIRIMYGVPGSGNIASQIYSSVGSSMNYTDANIPNNTTGYYYIDITNGSSRIVTAPIWYTRIDGTVPVKLSSFLAQKINNIVKLSWSTEQEFNSSHFVIERSADGRTWSSIAIINAAGSSTQIIDYTAFDNSPLQRINYYRIKQVDRNNAFEYSPVKSVLFNSRNKITIAPNPATNFINVSFSKNNTQPVTVQLINPEGKKLYEEKTNQSFLHINTASLGKGIYFVKIIEETEVTTQKVFIL